LAQASAHIRKLLALWLSAAGVAPKRTRFGQHAAARGYTTLTLSYSSIGLSKSASLMGFSMDYLGWARQDLAAAVDAMARDTVPLFMVGHTATSGPGAEPLWNDVLDWFAQHPQAA
jgi:predicted alpha/beta hydrolase